MPLQWTDLVSTPNAKRWLNRPRGPRPAELLPGFRSTDSNVLVFTERLAWEANQALPAAVSEDGFCSENGVGGTFNRLLCVTGYGMDPLPIPVMNNSRLRADAGLAEGFTSREHERIFNDLVDLMFGYSVPADVSIRKPASTGIPFFTNDLTYKKTMLMKALLSPDDYLASQLAFKPEALTEWHSVIAYAINERQQPDEVTWDGDRAVPKERWVPDDEYARSGGSAGKLILANKDVIIEGRHMRQHSAMRRRTVWGMSYIPNYFMTALLGCKRKSYLERFEFTWKHRSYDHLTAKIKKFPFIVGADVKNMDNFIPGWLLRAFCDRLEQKGHFDARVVTLLRYMFHAPFVMPNPWRDKRTHNPFYGLPPDRASAFVLEPGLASGISINPDAGKLAVTFAVLAIFADLGLDVSDVGKILRGEAEIAILNMGDDTVFLCPDERIAKAVAQATSPYLKIEFESPVQFLGNVFIHTKDGARGVPNIVTYAVNGFAPEKGIDSPDRRDHWEIGVSERAQYYSAAPSYRVVDELIEHWARKALGISPRVLARVQALNRPALNTHLTAVDSAVLQNPHYLHYRISPEEVSPQVLDMLVATIPAADFYPKIRHLIGEHQ